jgi:hypothetical protein
MLAATFKNLTKHTGGTFAPILGDVHIYTTPDGSRALARMGQAVGLGHRLAHRDGDCRGRIRSYTAPA